MLMMATFRLMLVKRAYPMEEIRRMTEQASWVEPRIEISSIGFEAWMRK